MEFVRFLLVSVLLFSGAGIVGAKETPRRSTTAARVHSTPPKIDGVLNDETWQYTPRSGGFIQRVPDEGQPATDSTSVQFAYDDEALYVGITCYDQEPDKIVARLGRRDQGSLDTDWVHLTIDSNQDRQTAYSFFVTAAGVLWDGYYYNDDGYDTTWDGVWEGQAHIGDQGWSTEIRIPFSVLRFSPQTENVMGLNVDRYTTRKKEDVFWAFIPQKEKGWVSKFGDLRGIKGISPPKSREILPYAVARSTFEPKSGPNPDGRDYFTNLGVDIRYGLASNRSLNATVNPDFGQVEADPAVLNLSVFETFYEERRPFFVEGNQLFQTPYQLFYSRRIGRQPDRFPFPAGNTVLDRPEFTSILGATKLTGKSAGKTSFGLIEAVTAEEHATLATAGTGTSRFLVEPRTNYLVGRLQQDLFKGNSNIGVLATATNRASSGSAYTGGVDWSLFWRENTYQVSGQAAGSRVEDFGDARRGYATLVQLAKRAGTMQGNVRYEARSPGFDINDLGFVSRVGTQSVQIGLNPRQYESAGPFRRRYFNMGPRISWNYSRIIYQKELNQRSLRSNLVLRWEYRPGSTFFLVWSQSRQARAQEPELKPWNNLRKSFADEGANLFLVKLNYWMNI